MKKKIIIGASTLVVFVVAIFIYVLTIRAPYKSIESLQSSLSKENTSYEVSIEYSSIYNGGFEAYDMVNENPLLNKVYNYSVSKNTMLIEFYADFKNDEGTLCYGEQFGSYYLDFSQSYCMYYSNRIDEQVSSTNQGIWVKNVLYDGDITKYMESKGYDDIESLSKYAYYDYINIDSCLDYKFMEIDGIYYESYNYIKVADDPVTVELKSNEAIITAEDKVITISNIGSTKAKSPLSSADSDGFLFDYSEYLDAYCLVEYQGNSKSVEVPATYNDGVNGEKSVKQVGSCTFFNNEKVEDIKLPEDITFMYSSSFYGCDSLDFITVSKDIKESLLDEIPSSVSVKYY